MARLGRTCSFALSLALTVLLCLPASGQYAQQGAKLVGSGATGAAAQGTSVALSADGNTAIVGGPDDNGNIGTAWVYTRTGGAWSQEGSKLTGAGAVGSSRQGIASAISADGNTAVVGGWTDDSFTGATWVFTRTAGVWSQQGGKLVGTGSDGSPDQGTSVAVSGDGNTLLVGGPTDSSGGIGAAWVFTRSGGVWTQQGGKLKGTGRVGGANQGYSVALSYDGNTALVGGYADSSAFGAVWVYTRSGGVWTQQGSKLVPSDAESASPFFGIAVSLSDDGNTALIGGHADGGARGSAWVFTRSGSVWSQQGPKLIPGDYMFVSFHGTSVDLSADGNTAVVGGSLDNSNVGATWIYRRSGSTWTQAGPKLVGTGTVGSAFQGCRVAVSADGNTVLSGGYGDNSNFGAAWVFASTGKPEVTGVNDIPNDQGGLVRLMWKNSSYDNSLSTPQVSSYSIFRQSASTAAPAARAWRVPEAIAFDSSLLGYDYVMDVPAFQLPTYQAVVPTLEDSSSTGPHLHRYRVVARTSDLNAYFVSAADSGCSVDNLSPIPPAGLVATAMPGPQVDLDWNSPTDADVGHYKVYRSLSAGFIPAPGDYIGTSTTTGFTDAAPVPGTTNYYRVVAVDVHDNQSPPSAEAEAQLTVIQFAAVKQAWNMVSVPVAALDFDATSLYPTATSPAYAYAGGYTGQATLQNGKGYWLRFDAAEIIPMVGYLFTEQTVNVAEGWNLIGTLSTSIEAAGVGSIPGGIMTSEFFSYNGSYQTAAILEPGAGYWIKASEPGQLLLSSSASVPASSRIRMELPGDDLPPPPPAEADGEAIPSAYSLAQNYPNPFNPVTVISYALASAGHVRLSVYNALGQEVAVLVDEVQDPGNRSVAFDASGLPSGVYTYRITAGAFSGAKKLLLVR